MSEIVSEPIKQRSAEETAQYWLDCLARILPDGRFGCFSCLEEFEKARKASGLPLEHFEITLGKVKRQVTPEVIKELNVLGHKSVLLGMLDDARKNSEFGYGQFERFAEYMKEHKFTLNSLETNPYELIALNRSDDFIRSSPLGALDTGGAMTTISIKNGSIAAYARVADKLCKTVGEPSALGLWDAFAEAEMVTPKSGAYWMAIGLKKEAAKMAAKFHVS